MKKKVIIKILISFSFLILGLVGFYKFMTYDRNYTWSKEIKDELATAAKRYGFTVVKTGEVSVDLIKLPIERTIKINIQKALSKVHLMSYGQEFGESILLRSDKPKEMINCKVWCLGDYVIGLEIEIQ